MILRNVLVAVFLLCFSVLTTFGQSKSKPKDRLRTDAARISEAPKVDGDLQDAVWQQVAGFDGHFVQSSPKNGAVSAFKTEVKIAYDDRGIYVSALMKDPQPDSIFQEMGIRDTGYNNSDIFSIAFDTYNNQQNAFVFMVSAAGTQSDYFETVDNQDFNWNAVWKSEVSINKWGWQVEMFIPYMALRFPKAEVQTWGLNIHRVVKRKNEFSYWNYVDPNTQGFVTQFGELEGLKDLKPPLRLAISPYLSSYYNIDGAADVAEFRTTAGLDLKWGINQAFTLDMTLIPDFGQVRADNQILNLSAFEVRFEENRPFFTEGTELFNRGDMFYSRRVGTSFGSVEMEESEELVSRSFEAPLLNASKVSGRLDNGLGIGVFNAITDANRALVKDTLTDKTREVLVDPLTNFNAIVLEQNLKNNSNVAFMNTNVHRGRGGEMANVSRLDWRLFNKTNTYAFRGSAAYSHINEGGNEGEKPNKTGHNIQLNGGKVSGKYQYVTWASVVSENYDPNDMGFLRRNNLLEQGVEFTISEQTPFSIYNNMEWNIGYEQRFLVEPFEFTNLGFFTNINAQFKNFMFANAWFSSNPIENYDYYDPRSDFEYFFTRLPNFDGGLYFASDGRKRFQLQLSQWFWACPQRDQFDNGFNISPRFRINKRATVSMASSFGIMRKEKGFVDHDRHENGDINQVIYGNRNRFEWDNSMFANYSISNKMGVNLRLRHYWSNVVYDELYALGKDGELYDTDFPLYDEEGNEKYLTNFNAFNVELTYSWEFASSSFLTFVWKNQVYAEDGQKNLSYGENLRNTLASDQLNSLSLRLIYFLDIQQVKDHFLM
ncbi:hypothetical protein PEPS_27470 (plasmid) [Persicobacter psychrovividus]|uniref:Carbohydrate binding protein with CBM9 domain n=1 Tax=Persicobacter psychrovividus TaxID=387638 RepID=A0ABM7VHL4_9BACT|nr:hypothetical protein PEPS_27470 [Persicobacter psychrovividus]